MIIAILHILVAVAIVVLVLLQERSGGISGLLGGSEAGTFYHTRRGLEKIVFGSTIVLLVIFVALSVVQLVVR